MKRAYLILMTIFLCALLCLAFSSCGGGTPEGDDTENSEHTHTFGEWTITREATCNQEGERKQVCTCGDFKTEAIPTIAHTLVDVEGIVPTCEKPGRTSGKNCSFCDTIIIAQRIIPPTGHEEKILPRKEATCKETGLTEGTGCANCDVVITNQEILPIVSCNIVDGFCTMCKVSYASEGLIFKASDDMTYAILTDVGTCTDSVIYIPATYQNLPVKEIGEEAFAYTASITEIHIPSTVEVIGEEAFASCQGFERLYLTKGLKQTKNGAFKNCSKLKDVYYSGKIEEWCVIDFSGYMPLCNKANLYIEGQLLTNLVITNDFTEIKQYAFADCISVTSITVEKLEKFPYMSSYAFVNNDTVGKLYINDLGAWCGYNFQGYKQNPISIVKKVYIDGETLSKLEIPSTVTEIKKYTFYNCTQLESLTIPNSVTTIGNHAFEDCTGLTSVTIGSGVTSIGNNAFYNCTGLTSIEIPNSVTSIGNNAFVGCTGLTSIVIPNSVASIGSSAFYNCTGLEEITVPFVGNGSAQTHFGYIFGASSYSNNKSYVPTSLKKVTITGGGSIGSNSFYNCTGLTNVTIGSGVTTIGDYAFYNCTGLTSIEIPNSVTVVGTDAFYSCTLLTKVDISDIGAWCNISFGDSYANPLYYAKKLYLNGELVTDLVIPNGVTSIGEYAFYNCTVLTSVTIESGVTSIGSSAFYNCKGLTSVTIGDSVTSIGTDAFRNCTALTRVDISDIGAWCNISFGNYLANPLYYAKNLYLNGELVTDLVIPNNATSIGNYAFNGCTGLTSVTIPNSVTTIGSSVFSGCTGLTSVVIPSSVTTIGSSAFYGCTGLEEITVPFVGNGSDKTHFGYIFGASSYSYNNSYVPTSLKKVTITGGGSIGDYGFYNCKGLTSIEIPNSVTTIGSSAFSDCTGLEEITVPFVGNGSDQTHFGYIFGASSYSYNYSYVPTNLKSVTVLGDEIGNYAFYDCTGLTNVTIGSGVTIIGTYAFSGCTGLTSITIPNSVATIGTSAFSSCTGITSITIPNSVTSIGFYAFRDCTGLSRVDISDIGAWCNISFGNSYANPLYYAKNLYLNGELVTDLVIPNSITSINNSAFYYCTGLTSVTIGSGVKTIGTSAFYGCKGLTSVTIPDSVTSIGSGAFENCTKLTRVDISDIGAWCNISFGDSYANPLRYAKNLYLNGELVTDLIIPNNATSIGDYAFYYCTGFTSIEIPNSVTTIGSSAFCRCTGFTSVTIPNSVTTIGSSAFSGCTGLEEITVPFVGNGSDQTYFGYIFGASSYSYNNSYVPTSLKSVTVLGGEIGKYAFNGCKNLTSVTIGNSVTSIGSNAFMDCTSLTIYCEAESQLSGWNSSWNYYGCPVVWNCKNNDVANNGKIYLVDDGVRYSIYEGKATVEGQSTAITTTNIKEKISYKGNEYTVTTIGYRAFNGCTGLTSITIPNSVTEIGDYAFYNCTGLTRVDISDIGAWCNISFGYSYANPLYYAKNLYLNGELVTDLVIPNSVTTISNYAFSGCKGLTNVVIPNSVTTIGSDAFYNCTGLTSVEIPNSVTVVGSYAFYNCTGLTSVTIPNSVTKIGSSAFYNCTGLTSIEMPNSVTTIGGSAFEGCTGIKEMTIPFAGNGSNQTHFGYIFGASSYSDNKSNVPTSLKKVTITGGGSIGDYAFYNCTGLTRVTIGNGVTTIGNDAFYGCTGLTSVTIPNSVTTIGRSAFYGCTGLTRVTIGNGVTTIGYRAFNGCTGLTSIVIPNSVTSIGSYAFYNCTGLKEITVPFLGNGSDQTHFGYIFGASSYSNNKSYVPTSLKKVTITGGGSIGDYAFYNCTGLTSVTIPNSVSSIGSSAFSGCTGLTSVEIPNSVTSIGNYAFSGCTGLKSVTIPNGVTSIGNYAFRGCTGLTSVTIGDSVTSIGSYAFENCTGLEEMTIPFAGNGSDKTYFGYIFGASSYSDNKSYVPTSLKKVTVLGGKIGSYAFYNCTGLASVTIGSGVTSIVNYAFYNCTGLTRVDISDIGAWCNISFGYDSANPLCYAKNLYLNGELVTDLVIPNSITSISSYAFEYCTGLTSITIPNSVTSIGNAAFSGCTGLTSITIPNSVTKIGNDAFYNCTGLTSVTIGDSVTTIGRCAFDGCIGLTSITIPNSVTTIGDYAFRYCTGLTIYCEATSKPSGWSSSWNYSDRPVVWDYKNK